MNTKSISILFFFIVLFTISESKSFAQKRPGKFYMSTVGDGNLLSTSILAKDGKSPYLTTVRYTNMFKLGTNFNYEFNNNFGVFSGWGLKNIGFIEKKADSTIKRRVYALGVPVGIMLGDLNKGNFFLAGAGVDLPFHYKEKGFIKRNKKKKTREWFSNRTPNFMGYFFVGAHIKQGLDIKFSYYPQNFLNSDYVDRNGFEPFKNHKVNLMVLSFGFNVPYRPKEFKESIDTHLKNI